jgi:hypothetical protein
VAVWRQQVFSLFVQEIVEVHATRNLSQGGFCYMLIQILQSKDQLLMSGARPVAGGLGRVERVTHGVCKHSRYSKVLLGPSGEAWAPRGMDRCYRLYILLVSRRLGWNRIIRVTHGVCKHSGYSEVLLASARSFYLPLLERVFHVKMLYLHAVIFFSFFVIAYRFYNILIGMTSDVLCAQWACLVCLQNCPIIFLAS